MPLIISLLKGYGLGTTKTSIVELDIGLTPPAKFTPQGTGIIDPGPPAKGFKLSCSQALGIVFSSSVVISTVIPIAHPFPNIARHIVYSINRDSVGVTANIGHGVGSLPFSLECSPAFGKSVSPWVHAAAGAAGGFFPFRFCRQTLAPPFAVDLGIIPAHLCNRLLANP